MHHLPVGETFELDGTWYVIVEADRKKAPNLAQRITPRPQEVGPEYIHSDGLTHVCKNRRCPNLVPRSKNRGVSRLYCSRYCGTLSAQRKYESTRGGGRFLAYDPLGRLYAVVQRRAKTKKGAWLAFVEHSDGVSDRCPEANENSNFKCPGAHNTHSYTSEYWERAHQGGPYPGACLIYATLKDHYRVCFYEEAGMKTDRHYTAGHGEQWHWKDEENMLPLPQGVVRA